MEQHPLLQTNRTVPPIRPESVSRPCLLTASINAIAAVPDRIALVLSDYPMAGLSPDGEWVAAASDDRLARLWPIEPVSL